MISVEIPSELFREVKIFSEVLEINFKLCLMVVYFCYYGLLITNFKTYVICIYLNNDKSGYVDI